MTKTISFFNMIVKMFEVDRDKYNDESLELTPELIDEFAAERGYTYDIDADEYVKTERA